VIQESASEITIVGFMTFTTRRHRNEEILQRFNLEY
jgi:hypothetical protein